MQLSELVPEYVAPDVFKEFLCGVKGSGEKPLPAKLDWLYFGTFFDLNNAPPLLIASPQAFSSGDKMKRVIVRGNCSGAFLNDDEYRQELRKTIEAMHKRAGTPTTPDAVEKAPAH